MITIRQVTQSFLQLGKGHSSSAVLKMSGSSWAAAREKFSSGSNEDRRSNYSCGPNFVALQAVPTWAELSQSCPSAEQTNRAAVDQELNKKISLFKGDITKLEVDAIVNAANKQLRAGGGVDGAIHRGAGPELQQECNTIAGGCPTGEAKLTGGYRLPAKYIIQTVGPMQHNSHQLESCYENSLQLAMQNKLRSVAFPCISTGVYGYPNEDAAEVALSTTRAFLEKHPSDFDRIIFCVFLEKDEAIYKKLLPVHFPAS